MARLIVKAPYIKGGGGGGYLKYISTRERVELLEDERRQTRRQEELIQNLTRDFPKTMEYSSYLDYTNHPSRSSASAFITEALEDNSDEVSHSEIYMNYIATRPRAERHGSHGLFGDDEHVDLKKAVAEVENYEGNVWTPIISLKREDAVKYGYDNAEAWRNLIRAHRNEIAEAFKISPNDFRWYAAFHDEGEHPHVHMMVWSTSPGQAYLSTKGIEQIKSTLTNDIFAHELVQVYEQKTASRDELVREARRTMTELCAEMKEGIAYDKRTEELMEKLAAVLPDHGKMSYGYMPKPVKRLVDEVVDTLAEQEAVKKCYAKWCDCQWQVESYYHDKPRQERKLSQEKEFRQIKNAVIKEAVHICEHRPSFEEKHLRDLDERSAMYGAPPRIENLWYIINDDDLPFSERDKYVEEMLHEAERGDWQAQYAMGVLYRDGPLVTPDLEEAEYWFRLSAEQGCAPSMYVLGKLYLDRDSWMFDAEKGIELLHKAAEHGHNYAMYRLGKEYMLGRVIERNDGAARYWFSEAEQRGNPYAAYQIGKMFLEPDNYDYDTAKYYLNRAAIWGNEHAQYLLSRLDEQKPAAILLSATRLLYHLGNIFQEHTPQDSTTSAQAHHIDSKRMRRLQEKRLAMGHKPDDHEEMQRGYGGMQAPW